MTKLFKNRIVFYTALFLGLMALFFALLFLAGLVPEKLVFKNYSASYGQFATESRQPSLLGLYPKLLNGDKDSAKLDNGTEVLILKEALYLDTLRWPESVFTNAFWSEENDPLTDFRDLAKTEKLPEPNGAYSRYFMGFRTYVRAMLGFMTYPQIRRAVQWAVLLLFIGFLHVLETRLRLNGFETLLLAGWFLLLNPVILMSSLQYSCCWLIAFSGGIAILKWGKDGFVFPVFFILGAVTQYLDFYTTPVVTFVLPATTWLAYAQRRGLYGGFRKASRFVLKGLAAWAAAYFATWLFHLAAVRVFTGENAFASAFAAVNGWFSGQNVAETETFLSKTLHALRLCAANMYSLEGLSYYAVLLITGICRFLKRSDKRLALSDMAGYLLLALLPAAWIAVASEPSIVHSYFQYRALGGTVFAACVACFRLKPRELRSADGL